MKISVRNPVILNAVFTLIQVTEDSVQICLEVCGVREAVEAASDPGSDRLTCLAAMIDTLGAV